MPDKLVQIETHAGEPISVGDTRLIPMAQSLRVLPPGKKVGLIWNRPVSILVQTPGGQEHILPVFDFTRRAQLALLGLGMIGSLLTWLAIREK
jgi:hypothetical protein